MFLFLYSCMWTFHRPLRLCMDCHSMPFSTSSSERASLANISIIFAHVKSIKNLAFYRATNIKHGRGNMAFLKCSAFGFGFPLAWVVLSVALELNLDPDSYLAPGYCGDWKLDQATKQKIYTVGFSYCKIGVILFSYAPIMVAITSNTAIFAYSAWKVFA